MATYEDLEMAESFHDGDIDIPGKVPLLGEDRQSEARTPSPPVASKPSRTATYIPQSSFSDENLKWFRDVFSGKVYVTERDFKNAAKDSKFAEQVFNLFDIDQSSSVSLQELIGGMGKLTTSPKKRKILKWFEDVFSKLAGEDELLQLDEFQTALHTRGFIERFFQLMTKDDKHKKISLEDLITNLTKLTCDLNDKMLAWYEQQFSHAAGEDRVIDLDEFKGTLLMRSRQKRSEAFNYFSKRLFELFDSNNDGTISLKELMDGLTVLTSGSEAEKLHFLFRVYDVNGDEAIELSELRRVLEFSMEESNVHLTDEQLDKVAKALFDDIDTDGDGEINFDEFYNELQMKHPKLIENLTINAVHWLNPPRSRKHYWPTWLTLSYVRNNLTWIAWILIYLLVNVVLFVAGAVHYRGGGPAVAIARGCGQCLNFNPTWVVILMMRKLLTWLRSTRFAFLLPLDQSIEFHKLTGWCILLFSCVHAAAHFVNLALLSLKEDALPIWRYYLAVNTGVGWVAGTAGLTGVLLLINLMIIVTFSLIRSIPLKGAFEIFYWSHRSFVFWYILLILHAPHFWKWFIVPGLFYLVEWILRLTWVQWALYGGSKFRTDEVNLLPSKVTHLVITRPSNFSYQPGDYVFILIPAIARYEWHPFTISSAPEQPGFFSLHIQSLGNWTNTLYDHYKQEQQRNRGEEERRIDKERKVYIEGPYGAPAVHIFQAEHAVLIASNIGVTPFASILQSIMLRCRSASQMCPNCNCLRPGDIPSYIMRLKKVDFYWVFRDQHSFEWFLSLLTELEIDQSKQCICDDYRFLDMNLYMTAQKATDIKSIGLQIALDNIRKKEEKDLLTGLRTPTKPGRPKWSEIFPKLEETSKQTKNQIDVFFCGSPKFGEELKGYCAKYKFKFHKEIF